MKAKIYHLNSKSLKVLFRNEDDYLTAINRLFVCAANLMTDVLAYCFLSTHFHFIIQTYNIDEFVRSYKKSLTQTLNNRYNRKGKLFDTTYRELTDPYELIIALNYVLKNPVHHKIAEVAFSYPYSSIGCYFSEEIQRVGYYSFRKKESFSKASDLDFASYREMFGSYKANDSIKIIDSRYVLPECFVKANPVCALYNNAKTFMYNMNKALKEEIDMFGNDFDLINNQFSLVSLNGKLSDTDVCKVVDDFASPQSYVHLSKEEVDVLYEKLRKRGVDKYQFQRCVY